MKRNSLAGGVVYRTNRLWADMASLIIELSIPMAGDGLNDLIGCENSNFKMGLSTSTKQ